MNIGALSRCLRFPAWINHSEKVAALLGGLGTLVVIIIFLALFAESSLLTTIQAIGSVAIASSAIIAYRLYLANVNRHAQEDQRAESKTFLEESKNLLDRAYETFTRSGDRPPKNDRLMWLSTARMIVRFQNIRSKITEADHKVIADEAEEYARLKFYTVLYESENEFTLDYFVPDRNPYGGEAIHRRSVAVIFDFSRWPDDMPDPLDQVDDVELFARGAVPVNFLGVHNFLEQYQEYWESIQRKKDEFNLL